MREKCNRMIDEIIVHCSASGPSTKMEDIRRWHIDKGWDDIGYNYVIESTGLIRMGREWSLIPAHCEGHNAHSIGVCLVGGFDGRTLHRFSENQFKSLRVLLDGLFMQFGKIPVWGHSHYNKHKTCPNFDINEWLKTGKAKYIT